MSEKIRKTLYLPQWLVEILDSEGEIYDGPGVVAAASIHNFSKMKKKNKISVLENFRSHEIQKAYLEDDLDNHQKTIHPDAQGVVSRSKARSTKRKRIRSRSISSKSL